MGWDKAVMEASEKVESKTKATAYHSWGGFEWDLILDYLIASVVSGIIASVVFAWFVLALTTGNLLMASICTFCICSILLSELFFMSTVFDYVLDLNAAIILVVVVGLSVDYTVHFGHAYNECGLPTRYEKTQHALTSMGISIFSGAITTLLAGVFLFSCAFTFFFVFGLFIVMTIFFSFLNAFLVFPSLMMFIGPRGIEPDFKY